MGLLLWNGAQARPWSPHWNASVGRCQRRAAFSFRDPLRRMMHQHLPRRHLEGEGVHVTQRQWQHEQQYARQAQVPGMPLRSTKGLGFDESQ